MGPGYLRGRRLLRRVNADCRLAIVVVLVILAFTTRIVPLTISNLPFNNDGISECRIASDIVASGHLDYPDGSFYIASHTAVTPAYDILLASVASTIGVTPLEVAQAVVAVFSVITVVGIYLISLQITKSRPASLTAAFTLSLLGTFVYLTGSTWKESLGVALLIVVTYAYLNRSRKEMFVLELAILAVFPIVHHYITLLVYLTLATLTLWSVVRAAMVRRLLRRHLLDSAILGVVGVVAYMYYRAESLDRLAYIGGEGGFILFVLSFAVVSGAVLVLLARRSHSRYTFAYVPASFVFGLFVYDYYFPIFPYSQGSPEYVLMLGITSSIIIGFAWFGFESILETKSAYRSIPLGMLAPALTLILFAFMSGLDRAGHQIVYRTFDFADPALAVGIACAVASMKRQSLRKLSIFALLAMLLISFPFGYATNTLTGIRHDTQDYEVDALSWVYSVSNHTYSLHSDERISYNARAFYDYSKCAYLPSKLANREALSLSPWYVLLEEWTTLGVSDYPNGHPILDEDYVLSVLSESDVYFVGGPSDNNIVVFSVSSVLNTEQP